MSFEEWWDKSRDARLITIPNYDPDDSSMRDLLGACWNAALGGPEIIVGRWINEDELPQGYPYEEMWPYSKLGQDGLGGVRIFPAVRQA